MPDVAVVLGSDSDLPKIKGCFDIFEKFDVPFELIISSAHRTPGKIHKWTSSVEEKGIKIIIAIAGGAAHLPGVIASLTTLPVIGVPVETKISGGLDSIFSILQMPSGIPVATMPAGKSGAVNAVLFAISILALSDNKYSQKLKEYRKEMADVISKKNETLNSQGYRKYTETVEKNKR